MQAKLAVVERRKKIKQYKLILCTIALFCCKLQLCLIVTVKDEMKKHSLLLAFLLAYFSAVARPIIKFEKNTYNIGNVKKEDGKIACDFEFTNEGNAALVITKVQSSCACATPNWTKAPVEEGEKGKINVVFMPVGRLGYFSKSIAVYSNAAKEKIILRIEGNLLADDAIRETTQPSQEVKTSNDYQAKPVNAPSIQYATKILDLGFLPTDTIGQGEILLTNKGVNCLEIKSIANENSELLITKPLKSIAKNNTDGLNIVVNTKGLNPGTYRKTFTIQTNDPEQPVVLFGVLWKIE